ncbi:unnamed protein product [Blepharisma stoltei]|uniref:Uncharacterized protein n=1 Tax=Blepharisma stoltei TaxID=1481888 RepID=A0AAU9K6C1_9CILI|nr:unnamed protein product [Blepharisma stoltei]
MYGSFTKNAPDDSKQWLHLLLKNNQRRAILKEKYKAIAIDIESQSMPLFQSSKSVHLQEKITQDSERIEKDNKNQILNQRNDPYVRLEMRIRELEQKYQNQLYRSKTYRENVNQEDRLKDDFNSSRKVMELEDRLLFATEKYNELIDRLDLTEKMLSRETLSPIYSHISDRNPLESSQGTFKNLRKSLKLKRPKTVKSAASLHKPKPSTTSSKILKKGKKKLN